MGLSASKTPLYRLLGRSLAHAGHRFEEDQLNAYWVRSLCGVINVRWTSQHFDRYDADVCAKCAKLAGPQLRVVA